LVPWGIKSRAKIIATGIIANTGTGTPASGDYRFELRDAAGRKWKSGHIEGSHASGCWRGTYCTGHWKN